MIWNSMMGQHKVGDRVRVVGNQGGHQTPLGTISKVSQVHQGGNVMLDGFPSWFHPHDVQPCALTKAAMLEEQKTLTDRLAEINVRLRWLEENKLEELNERQYQVYRALDIVQNTPSKIEAAKQLAKLLDEGFSMRV